MSWWKSAPTPRESQIASIEKLYPRARKAVQDRDGSCQYDVDFQRPFGGSSVSTLRIFLPRKFPDEKPILVLMKDIEHPWVNQYNQVIGHQYWHSWNKQMDVGTVINEVLIELKKKDLPPPLPQSIRKQATKPENPQLNNVTQNNPIIPSSLPPPQYEPPSNQNNSNMNSIPSLNSLHTGGAAEPLSLSSQTQSQNRNQQNQQIEKSKQEEIEEKFEIPIPDIPTSFPDLQKMSTEELENLYNNEVELYEYISNKIPGIHTMQEIQSDALYSNYKIANKLISDQKKKDEYINLRNNIKNKYNLLLLSKKEYDNKLNDYLNKEKLRLSDAAIINNMRKIASEWDEKSEILNHKFNQKEIQVGEFVKEYRSLRKSYHIAAASVELHNKWGQKP